MNINSGVESIVAAPAAAGRVSLPQAPVQGSEDALRDSEAAVVVVGNRVAASPEQVDVVKQQASSVEMSKDQADRLAKKLEQTINGAQATQVQFRVEGLLDGKNKLNFAVIDKKTGKVIWEFPPKSAAALVEKRALKGSPGVLIDEKAA